MTTHARTILDAVHDRVKTIPGFSKYWRTPMRQIAPEDLPMLGTLIVRESRQPDGDANTGNIKFLHQLHIGVSGSIAHTDDEDALIDLEDLMEQVDSRLLTDPTFVQLIEGVLSVDRKTVFTREGETSLAEIQIEYVFSYRTDWLPEVDDDFLTMRVTSRYPTAETTDSEVEQVEAEFELEQNP